MNRGIKIKNSGEKERSISGANVRIHTPLVVQFDYYRIGNGVYPGLSLVKREKYIE